MGARLRKGLQNIHLGQGQQEGENSSKAEVHCSTSSWRTKKKCCTTCISCFLRLGTSDDDVCMNGANKIDEKDSPMTPQQRGDDDVCMNGANKIDEKDSPMTPQQRDFKMLLQEIQRAAADGFQNLIKTCTIELPVLELDEKVNFCWDELQFDEISEGLLPADIKEAKYRALKTIGDGNCLFRAASILAFGNQHRHEEMRVRTVFELVSHSDFYQNCKDVERILLVQARDLSPNDGGMQSKLSPQDVKREFESDVLNAAGNSSWASYWDLLALGTVLNRRVQSVYPDSGTNEIRKYFNTIIHPRRCDEEKEPLRFMWTHTNGGDVSKFRPNHFVPLISASKIPAKDPLADKGNVPSEGDHQSMPFQGDRKSGGPYREETGDTSKVTQSGLQRVTSGVSVLKITLASDAEGWDKVVNGQLELTLALDGRVVVTGFVPGNTQEQREHARELGINLFDAKSFSGYSTAELLSYPPDHLDIDILLMHSYGRDVGRQAQAIKETKNCKWVLMVHTISEELEKFSKEPATNTAVKESELQVDLCEKADLVIAVGPKVAEAFKAALSYCGKRDTVFTLMPRISHEFLGVRQELDTKCWDTGAKFRVLISGSAKYFTVKGCDIAATAIKLLQDSSYHLLLVVTPNDNTAEIEKAMYREGISVNQLTVKRCSGVAKVWHKLLCQVDLLIKPSRTEGFGMSGLRAISAALPFLISANCGLGIALKSLPSGKSHVVDSDEPQVWADKIKEVREKGSKTCHFQAEQLRSEYSARFPWEEQIDNLLRKFSEMFLQNQDPLADKCNVPSEGDHQSMPIQGDRKSGGPYREETGDTSKVTQSGLQRVTSELILQGEI